MKTKFPVEMQGYFRDTFHIGDIAIADTGDYAGQLFMFKLSADGYKSLHSNGGLDHTKLLTLHLSEYYTNSTYTKTLMESISKFTQPTQ